MRARLLLAFLAASMLLPLQAANAQAVNSRKVGVILQGGSWYEVVQGLREGLKNLGYVEGKQFTLEIHDMQGDLDAVDQTAKRMEQQQVALIYSLATSVSVRTKLATEKVPIVFVAGTDPVTVDLVHSLPRPGGRLTGVQFRATDLTGKRLEFLHEMAPKLRRVVAFYNPQNPAAVASARVAHDAARNLGIEIVERHVATIEQLQKAVEAFQGDEADAVLAISDAMVDSQIHRVIDMANAHKLPSMLYDPGAVEKGGLVTYSADYSEVGRMSAKYVHRVLEGANPADLPVEGADKLSLVINLKTAKQIGLVIPAAVLARADKIIE